MVVDSNRVESMAARSGLAIHWALDQLKDGYLITSLPRLSADWMSRTEIRSQVIRRPAVKRRVGCTRSP